ncbi:MAG: 2-amino-4-hydroxy-6-hydroxymethyldihydropteridine diphosphokinase [Planctomycetota bacterium]|jgi:2-amino-4-hydroxy-6-hydroxymethyldihydropteridine diphosphokinase
MVEAAIALGSNIPPRRRRLKEAMEEIRGLEGSRVLRCSQVYETEPVGGPPQGWFLNAALLIETPLSAPALLDALLAIETRMGRERKIRNEPRVIDLDIIFYGEKTLESPSLTLPHPRFRERGFVLLPLCDIIPAFVDPLTNRDLATLLNDWKAGGGESCRPLGGL